MTDWGRLDRIIASAENPDEDPDIYQALTLIADLARELRALTAE